MHVGESWKAFKSIGFVPKNSSSAFFGVDEIVYWWIPVCVLNIGRFHSLKKVSLQKKSYGVTFCSSHWNFSYLPLISFRSKRTKLRCGYSVDFSCSGCSWVHRAQFSMQCSLILTNGPEGYLVTLSLMFDVLGLVGSWKVEHGRNNQSQWFIMMAGSRNLRKHQESWKQSEQLSIYEGFLAAIWYWKASSHPVMFMEVLCNNWWPGMVWRYTVYSSRAILSMSQKQGFVKSMPLGALVMISEGKSVGSWVEEDHDPSPQGSNLSEDIGLYNHLQNARYLYRFHSHLGSRGSGIGK